MDERTNLYANTLARMIRCETISRQEQPDKSKFLAFHELLRELFPRVFAACDYEAFDGSFLLRWPGRDAGKAPILFMNHHDVVEASGAWAHAPFSGDIADGKLWGRGTLDTKGGLWGMLTAAEELLAEDFVPAQDIWFESSCTEETTGAGAAHIAAVLRERGIRFDFLLDEGGMIVFDPIGGSDGTFAMVGVGEKGCADLRFVARSSGGHASTPPKNSPLVRLGKFMAECEKKELFETEISPAVREMFLRMAPSVSGPLKRIMGNPDLFGGLITSVLPRVSETAGALLKTTLAFTMAQGSDGTNVLPQEAWVVGNMRFSHHQGRERSIAAVRALAEKFGVETEILDPGIESPMSSFDCEGFLRIERGVAKYFPGVVTSPYVMTGASDARYFGAVCENCFRFVPFRISDAQLASIHGLNECVDLETLAPAVDFYKYMMAEV